jgi:hypothetical protein
MLLRRSRSGSTIVFFALGLTVMIGAVALAVDIGAARLVRAELQNVSDASAMAGAMRLDGTDEGLYDARVAAVDLAALNMAARETVVLDLNTANDADGDVVLGFWDSDAGVFTPSMDPELVDTVVVRAFHPDLATVFAGIAFGRDTIDVAAASTVWQPPPVAAGKVDCFLPLAVPSCLFDEYPDQDVLDVDLVLNPDGGDNVGWAMLGTSSASASAIRDQIDNCESSGDVETTEIVQLNNGEITTVLRTLGDAIVDSDTAWDTETFGEQPDAYSKSYVDKEGGYGNTYGGPLIVFDEPDCTNVKFNGDEAVKGFVYAYVYDVVAQGSASDKNIKVRIDVANEYVYGTGDGGTLENGVTYQPPPWVVK